MSRTSTITIRGRVVDGGGHGSPLEFIRRHSGSVEIEGCVQGAVICEDAMDFVFVPVDESDPFELASQLLDSGRLSTIDCYLEIEGERRYFNFDSHCNGRLVITINANRHNLKDGATDFNWHYEKLVLNLKYIITDVDSIVSCDDL